ncbi:anti-sigma factor family protein [Kitasatospora sp. NPDC059571]|uniref:anti-sigma factor family protein n=1 Tax=Kitasatospora sp. NPDC059571 TaxID=3346871 RepID=UPI0036BE7158
MTPHQEHHGADGRDDRHDHDGPAGDAGRHVDVGAYILGVLDPEDVERFELHLAGCPVCSAEIDELSGVAPLLAELAEAGPVAAAPPPGLLDRLVGEVTATRRRNRVRRLSLVAAAAVLVIGGPLVTIAATGHDQARAPVAAAAQFAATDPTSGVSAAIGVQPVAWGSQVTLALSNVRGPQSCDLVAVSRSGERQTVTTWSVPPTGYDTEALRTGGGAALHPADIDHFEVRTLDGDQLLVSVPAHTA